MPILVGMNINTSGLAVVFGSLFVLSLALGGCAAGGEPGEGEHGGDDGAEAATEAETATGIATGIATDGVAPTAYQPRVMRTDIVQGGGKCAGNLCTINGTTWNCGGGGYCSRIYL